MNGFFIIERTLTKHWCASDPNFLATWVWLLSEANWQDKKALINSSVVELKRGQLIFGLNAFSHKSGVSVAKLRRIINTLEEEGMINRQKTNKYSIISIVKYDEYQSVNKQTTSKEQSEHTQTTTPKPVKQTKPLNKDIYIDQFNLFWSAYPKRKGANPKEPARKKFISLCKEGVDPDKIIKGAKLYGVERAKENDPKYTCQAIVFLNQGRYGEQEGEIRSPEEIARIEAYKTAYQDRSKAQWKIIFPTLTNFTLSSWRVDLHGPKPHSFEELQSLIK